MCANAHLLSLQPSKITKIVTLKPIVLLIAPQPFFQWRGSPIRVKFNLLALSRLGYDVHLLTLPIGEDFRIEGVNILRVANPFRVRNIPIGPSRWKLFFDLLLICKALMLCRRTRYTVIHGIEEAGFFAALLAWLFNTKAIFEKHSDPFSYATSKGARAIMRVYASVEKIAVRMVDAAICTGPGLVDQVNAMETSTRAFAIADIPSSLRESTSTEISRIRAELCQDEDELLITFVGSFAVYQGVDLMFAAIAKVVPAERRARFIIIGGSSEEIAARQAVLTTKGIADKVTFLGKIDPDILPDYLSAADILLSPRISGVNTPLKVLDYMKAGCAIAATDIPANRLLLDESTALFAAPEPEAYAAAILTLAGDPAKRQALGQACRKLYMSTYTFQEHCVRLKQCYDHVLAE